MFIIIIIIFIVFFVYGVVMSISNAQKAEKKLEEKFLSAKYNISEKKYGLIVDENAHKWACVSYPGMPILDFSDITDVELVEEGITYKSEDGILRAVTGGALFGAAGAIVGASTAKKTKKSNNIYVIIYTKNLKMPNLKINAFNRSYGEGLVGMVKAMQNYSVKSNTSIAASYSAADEIAKYKSLLDSGAITKEEYDKKKSELLNF